MGRILIGNIKGPQGAQGIQGPQGPVGATGPQGPMPDLINNALATQAGVAALDAAMGKTLQDQITQLNSDSIKDNMFLAERINLGYIALTKNIDNGIYSLHFYDDSVQWFAEARFVAAGCAIESDLSKLSIANIQRISSYDGILYITLANGDVYEIEMAKQ